MAARRSYIIKAVVRHLFATVEECLTPVTHTGRGRVTTGGLHDQNPHRNVGVLLPSRFRHRDRDRGCQPDHLRTPKWNQRGPAAALPGPFACATCQVCHSYKYNNCSIRDDRGDHVASAACFDRARKGVKRRLFRWCARSVIANRGDGQNDSSFLPSPVRLAPSRWPQCHVVRLVAQPSFLSRCRRMTRDE